MNKLNIAASTELAKPIKRIESLAKQMHDAGKQSNRPELKKCQQMISDCILQVSCNAMNHLDLSLVEQGHFSLAPKRAEFVPNKAVGQIARILSNFEAGSDFNVFETYDPELDTKFLGDANRIQQVLLILTSNAHLSVS